MSDKENNNVTARRRTESSPFQGSSKQGTRQSNRISGPLGSSSSANAPPTKTFRLRKDASTSAPVAPSPLCSFSREAVSKLDAQNPLATSHRPTRADGKRKEEDKQDQEELVPAVVNGKKEYAMTPDEASSLAAVPKYCPPVYNPEDSDEEDIDEDALRSRVGLAEDNDDTIYDDEFPLGYPQYHADEDDDSGSYDDILP